MADILIQLVRLKKINTLPVCNKDNYKLSTFLRVTDEQSCLFTIIVLPQAAIATNTTNMNISHFIYAFESDNTLATALINYIYELSAKVRRVFEAEA